MERLAGSVISIEAPDEEGRHRVTFAVTGGPGGAPLTYALVVDPDASSMAPDGELEECFEAYHAHEYDEGLNPTLRRQWKTARIADEIASRLLSSGALAVIAADEPDA